MVDHSLMKLGKSPTKHDDKMLAMANYANIDALPTPPDAKSYVNGRVDWGMMLNDAEGDCTCAATGHAIQSTSAAATGEIVTVPDTAIQTAYEGACGYVPGDASTDRGGVEIDVLKYFQKIGVGGVKLDAFVALEPQNRDHVELSVDLLGGTYIGLQLPISAQTQDVWHITYSGTSGNASPGSWGGHAVWVLGYGLNGLTCITWGQVKYMSWRFWFTYCDEAYGLILPTWFNKNNVAPSGFKLDNLLADSKLLAA